MYEWVTIWYAAIAILRTDLPCLALQTLSNGLMRNTDFRPTFPLSTRNVARNRVFCFHVFYFWYAFKCCIRSVALICFPRFLLFVHGDKSVASLPRFLLRLLECGITIHSSRADYLVFACQTLVRNLNCVSCVISTFILVTTGIEDWKLIIDTDGKENVIELSNTRPMQYTANYLRFQTRHTTMQLCKHNIQTTNTHTE